MKIFPERGVVRVSRTVLEFYTPIISPQRLTPETSNFVHWSAMQSLSLVISECFLSGRGQSPESNFYIVDFKKFRRRFVYDTLPPTKPPTSYHRCGQDMSYK